MEQKQFDCLQVTQVQVYPFKKNVMTGNIVGLATVVLNDQLQVRGIRIMSGKDGLSVAYPPTTQDETVLTLVTPITRELREHIAKCVLEKYQYEKKLG